VTKYKNRWIQFIEENPMKIPGFNMSQTVKPSLFKHSTNSPHHSADDNFGSDNDSGWGDDWNDRQQDNRKKGQHGQHGQHQHQQKFQKEEKSQFFYKSNTSKPNGGNDFDEHFGFNTMQPTEQHQYGHPQGGFNNSPGFRPGPQGHNFGYHSNNPNQQRKNKPFNTNQQNQGQGQGQGQQGPGQGQGQGQGQGNKWGYTNFF